eukprot:6477134-Pyramimonas_sp.AAC.1
MGMATGTTATSSAAANLAASSTLLPQCAPPLRSPGGHTRARRALACLARLSHRVSQGLGRSG